MELSKDSGQSSYYISTAENGFVIINGERLTRSIIISPNALFTDWAPQSVTALKKEDFQRILAQKPEVVLLGTGETHIQLPPSLLVPFYEHRIGVEVMHSLAACQTFNVLAADGRHVVAGIFL